MIAPGDTAFWTEAEGSPTFRVRCCCGWAKRVTSDVEGDELLEAHTFAHELIARSAS